MSHRYLLSVLAVLVLPVLVSAANTNRMPEVVVTSTRIPSGTEKSPTAITVLQAADIERQQIRNVSEALHEVPGVNVAQYGQPGGIVSVFMRGSESKHVLVLVDGIRVNDGFDGAFNFANLPVDNVERIVGDRTSTESMRDALAGTEWDSVIDVSGFVMAAGGGQFEELIALLDGSVGSYVFVSSIMAYEPSGIMLRSSARSLSDSWRM